MRRHAGTVATGVVAAALALVAGAACGAGDDDDPATELTIVLRTERGAPAQRYDLSCAPPRGSHPDPAAACAAARRAGRDAFRPVPEDAVCAQIYGGPERAHVTGTLDGGRVDAEFARDDGCEIGRWNRLRGLLPVTTSAP